MDECIYCKIDEKDCPVVFGYCHCGCGTATDTTTSTTNYYRGYQIPPGTKKKWRVGHWNRGDGNPEDAPIIKERRERMKQGICPYCGSTCKYGLQYCHCGCGRQTAEIEHPFYARGEFVGLPARYLKGHNHRLLTEQDVREIRYRYATDDTLTQRGLSEEYGVSSSTIARIVLYTTWKNVGIATPEEMGDA